MALTDQEETAFRALLAAVSGAGVSMDDITATLRIGKITTEISALEAQAQNLAAEKDAANSKAMQGINDLIAKRDEMQAALRDLLSGK